MIKITTIFLAPLVVVVLAGTSHAQLFIEDFDTFTGWLDGPGTKIASKDGQATNGWVKGTIHNIRKSVPKIHGTGINGTQSAIASVQDTNMNIAARDITGEINPNGNYMVRMLTHLDALVDGTSTSGNSVNPRSVILGIGDATMFERFTDSNTLWIQTRMIAPKVNYWNQITTYRGGIGRGNEGDNDIYADVTCTQTPEGPLIPLQEDEAFCLVDTSDTAGRVGVDDQFPALLNYSGFGTWMEILMNANMNNEETTAWFRDVDDTTGEATSPWTKLPWNFAHGYGSTTYGLPWTGNPVAAGFGVVGTSGGIIDNWISGHPLLANQGDFDGDGDIDGNDFLIWQNNFPRTDGEAMSFIGDATGDGNVDGDDFLVWQNSFPYPASLSKTPEPASLGLVILGGLMMLRRQRT